MSSKRKPRSSAIMNKARGPKEPSAGQDPEVDDFLAELRVQRKGGRLPQGCTPAEKRAALEALARLHGVVPIDNPAAMTAGFWPPEETADEIVGAVRALRREGK